jgi:site-specific DNA recombinase
MRAIGYIRVSTEDQANGGVSLDSQKAKIKTYCDLKDIELMEIIEDAGISAKDMKRPGAKKVLEMASQKEVDAVIVYKLDRMFRSTIDALNTTRMFDTLGVSFHSIHESLDTKSALGNFFFTLTAALAEMERRLIGERTQVALQHKKAKGERIGHIPFGYRLADDEIHLTKDTGEQAVLKNITSMRRKGLSIRKIADHLNAREILNRGAPWNPMSVTRVGKL